MVQNHSPASEASQTKDFWSLLKLNNFSHHFNFFFVIFVLKSQITQSCHQTIERSRLSLSLGTLPLSRFVFEKLVSCTFRPKFVRGELLL